MYLETKNDTRSRLAQSKSRSHWVWCNWRQAAVRRRSLIVAGALRLCVCMRLYQMRLIGEPNGHHTVRECKLKTSHLRTIAMGERWLRALPCDPANDLQALNSLLSAHMTSQWRVHTIPLCIIFYMALSLHWRSMTLATAGNFYRFRWSHAHLSAKLAKWPFFSRCYINDKWIYFFFIVFWYWG